MTVKVLPLITLAPEDSRLDSEDNNPRVTAASQKLRRLWPGRPPPGTSVILNMENFVPTLSCHDGHVLSGGVEAWIPSCACCSVPQICLLGLWQLTLVLDVQSIKAARAFPASVRLLQQRRDQSRVSHFPKYISAFPLVHEQPAGGGGGVSAGQCEDITIASEPTGTLDTWLLGAQGPRGHRWSPQRRAVQCGVTCRHISEKRAGEWWLSGQSTCYPSMRGCVGIRVKARCGCAHL